MTSDNFCFYLQNRLIQTSQTGGWQHSDTSPFSIPWIESYVEGSSEEVNKIKILKKKLEGYRNCVKLFTIIKLQKYLVISKMASFRSLFSLIMWNWVKQHFIKSDNSSNAQAHLIWACKFDEKAIRWKGHLMNCRFDELPLQWNGTPPWNWLLKFVYLFSGAIYNTQVFKKYHCSAKFFMFFCLGFTSNWINSPPGI